MKPIRLLVEMPSHGVFTIGGRMGIGPIEELIETTVDGLRRLEFRGVLNDDTVQVRAFVPERYRHYLRERRVLIGEDRVWCLARTESNRKSLAPFLASSDREWGEK